MLERLRACGLESSYEPPWEPRYASMVLIEPPEPGPPDVVVRPVESFDEFVEAHRLEEDVIELPDEDRCAQEEHQRTRWELHESEHSRVRVYVGLLDGEIVGVGRALVADVGVNLSGGSVRPEARGRGVYRALVRARWDDAVARGTPALTVQAGRMSHPVLERRGFEIVSLQECLIDPSTGPERARRRRPPRPFDRVRGWCRAAVPTVRGWLSAANWGSPRCSGSRMRRQRPPFARSGCRQRSPSS